MTTSYFKNVHYFFEWMDEQIKIDVVRDEFTPAEIESHREALWDEIAMREDKFLTYRVFKHIQPGDEEDESLNGFQNAHSYTRHYVLRFCNNYPSWYRLRPCSVN